jgi:hypothetical protein
MGRDVRTPGRGRPISKRAQKSAVRGLQTEEHERGPPITKRVLYRIQRCSFCLFVGRWPAACGRRLARRGRECEVRGSWTLLHGGRVLAVCGRSCPRPVRMRVRNNQDHGHLAAIPARYAQCHLVLSTMMEK